MAALLEPAPTGGIVVVTVDARRERGHLVAPLGEGRGPILEFADLLLPAVELVAGVGQLGAQVVDRHVGAEAEVGRVEGEEAGDCVGALAEHLVRRGGG